LIIKVLINFYGHYEGGEKLLAVIKTHFVIKGDLVLHKNAILKFLGNQSSIEVLGKAKISKKAIIEGQFKDISQKIQ